MPGHYGMSKGNGKGKKSKPAPKGTHRMPDGTLMTGSKHTKDSKPVKEKAKAKPKATSVAKSGKAGTGKGSQAMKDKMAKLRAMKKK